MISKGQQVMNIKTGKIGIVISDVTYRRNAGRSFPQVTVRWDCGGEWDILTRNLEPAASDE